MIVTVSWLGHGLSQADVMSVVKIQRLVLYYNIGVVLRYTRMTRITCVGLGSTNTLLQLARWVWIKTVGRAACLASSRPIRQETHNELLTHARSLCLVGYVWAHEIIICVYTYSSREKTTRESEYSHNLCNKFIACAVFRLTIYARLKSEVRGTYTCQLKKHQCLHLVFN